MPNLECKQEETMGDITTIKKLDAALRKLPHHAIKGVDGTTYEPSLNESRKGDLYLRIAKSGQEKVFENTYPETFRRMEIKVETYCMRGKGSRWRNNHDFTASYIVCNSAGEILFVHYAHDNDFLLRWLNETLDAGIPSNLFGNPPI
jgi:hypothetical protein